jgi:hypothetical protein
MIDDLRLQGYFCFISNTAYSFAGGRRTLLTPNGEFAVTFMVVGDPFREPDAIHADMRLAILKAVEVVRKEIKEKKYDNKIQ